MITELADNMGTVVLLVPVVDALLLFLFFEQLSRFDFVGASTDSANASSAHTPTIRSTLDHFIFPEDG